MTETRSIGAVRDVSATMARQAVELRFCKSSNVVIEVTRHLTPRGDTNGVDDRAIVRPPIPRQQVSVRHRDWMGLHTMYTGDAARLVTETLWSNRL